MTKYIASLYNSSIYNLYDEIYIYSTKDIGMYNLYEV